MNAPGVLRTLTRELVHGAARRPSRVASVRGVRPVSSCAGACAHPLASRAAHGRRRGVAAPRMTARLACGGLRAVGIGSCRCRGSSVAVGARSVHSTAGVRAGTDTDTIPATDPSYVVQQVKSRDYEHYLCGKLMPSRARDSFFVTRLFNLEVAAVRDNARGNATTGALRFGFWREVVDAAYSGAHHAHPLAGHLRRVVQEHQLTRRWFDKIIDARQTDLERGTPDTMAQVEEYANMTQGSLLLLGLEGCGVRDEVADHIAGHIGTAVGITTLIRGIPYHIQMEQRYLPGDVMAKAQLTDGRLLKVGEDAEAAEKLAAVVFEVACVAHAHLGHADEMAKDMGHVPDANAAFLPAVPVRRYLAALERANFNLLSPIMAPPRSPLRLQAALLAATFRNRF